MLYPWPWLILPLCLCLAAGSSSLLAGLLLPASACALHSKCQPEGSL